MARILYGVAGEGSGHASRAKIIIEHLQQKGHHVKIVSHDTGYDNLSRFFEVEKITGLRFAYIDNKVKYLRTLRRNFLRLPETRRSLMVMYNIFKKFDPEIIITDFEPLSAMAGQLYGLPLISIDNQHQITNTKITYPQKFRKDAVLAKAVIRLVMGLADKYLITSFFDTDVRNNNTYLFPPILRKEVLDMKPTEEDFVLVYITSNFEGLLPALEQVNSKFVVYGISQDREIRNIIFKNSSPTEFLKDLASCRAVIATAGSSLISEALYLGKPYLAIPIKAQFEQILNAYYLQKLGYGKFCENICQEEIEDFLNHLLSYSSSLKLYKRQDNSLIFSKIDKLIKSFEK